jgi:hypothetical protein
MERRSVRVCNLPKYSRSLTQRALRAAIVVLEADDIVEFGGGDLQHPAVGERPEAVAAVRRDVKRLTAKNTLGLTMKGGAFVRHEGIVAWPDEV